MQEVALQKPGKGLPFPENLLAKYIFFPKATRSFTWSSASSFFEREGQRMVELATPLDSEQLLTRVLITRVRGIEDSSRNWSVGMTLEHLMIVGGAIKDSIPKLLEGKTLDFEVDIAAVKPQGKLDGSIVSGYTGFVRDYLDTISALGSPGTEGSTLLHPWFGELNAFKWHCLAAVHQRIHRHQIESIVNRL